jgi:hypothetical protein
MHIIFGNENVNQFTDKHTVLELDSFRQGNATDIVTAYCVVETIPLMELPSVERHRNMHEHLIKNFKTKNWSFCEQAIEHLKGKWNGELDSFYKNLLDRLAEYKTTDPGADWDGILKK